MGEIYNNLSKESKILFDIIEYINLNDLGIKVCIQNEITDLWEPLEVTELGIKEKYGSMQ